MKRLFRVKANEHNEMIPNIRFHTLLHLELAALQEEDFDLELLGFDDDELVALARG
jgi:hypothetical protein